MSITIKIRNLSRHALPSYATEGSSGIDLQAYIEKDIIIPSMERKIIPTGIYMEIPTGYEAQIRPRSGLALHHGITVLNNPGTIDSDYRGEIKILLINLSHHSFTVKNGDRIAQIVVYKHEKVKWNP
ncbi:deoxyuridine 5'-triphosphate nucleotidohydrolase (plasmid) [Blattabacterium sp. (Mastotermes darwiniensis) str. MADAR]|jgi:dUTP pyrophosphatase|uniref:dUTP diphosphatase n=1 Tax=Blattabacterium sp. (Mastotermes darwiniensis) TaxID=39768 RepID=UPI000231DFD2|nr:dUTP diphosphatase [Blattabacterium sp. (Mastotermes darwiniensis)]AER40870.1 deoxyuridine 5'-triphosphate nucleotidohydrolase [Blattabacterium sp. (Mastotermes darwiniensis) str. MADAR]